jgi:localization factor PodJL
MSSQASWHSSSARASSNAYAADRPIDRPMDQRSVESLLRRLVELVEGCERRYGDALDELHVRVDQLSRTTDAARDARPSENAETFDRLHNQVSDLARRLDPDSSSPLDDFERLGKALLGGLDQDAQDTPSETFGYVPEPNPFASAAMASETPAPEAPYSAEAEPRYADFDYTSLEPTYPVPPEAPFDPDFDNRTRDIDERLVEIAQQLEQSIGTAMPTATIEGLVKRLDEIGAQLSETLEKAPTREALEHVEQQITDISHQVSRADEQLSKIAGIENHLIKLIERLDEKASAPPPQPDPAQLQEIAIKAATEAARIVAADAEQGTDRLDAMQRELNAIDGKSRERSDHLESTLESIHESLKQLAQQVERGSSAPQTKPRAPFLSVQESLKQLAQQVERPRQAKAQASQAKAPMRQARSGKPPAVKTAASAPAPASAPAKPTEVARSAHLETLRNRLGSTKPDSKNGETPTPFGRAKRPSSDEKAIDLDSTPPPPASAPARTTKDTRTAPLAALRDRLGAASPKPKEEETPPPFGHAKRPSPDEKAVDLDSTPPQRRARIAPRPGIGSTSSSAQHEPAPGKEKQTTDNLVAAARRAAQAAALRVESREERRASSKAADTTPRTEQPVCRRRSMLVIAATLLLALSAALLYGRLMSKPEEVIAPPAEQMTPAPAAKLGTSGSWTPLPNRGEGPTGGASDSAQGPATAGFTNIAKSAGRNLAMPASELNPEPQLVSLQPAQQASFPPGVTLFIEDPAHATKGARQNTTPVKYPMPPEALGTARNTSLVTRAQTLLNKLGYKVGKADGVMGSRTRTAIRLFQSRYGLGETGEVSAQLVAKLEGLTS